MLKYSFIVGTTAIVNLVLVLTNPPQIANAAPEFGESAPISQSKLITKDSKSLQINAKQQSDIQRIHETLTQYYRGFNEYNIERMQRVSISVSPSEKKYLQDMFSQLKSTHVDMSVEVQNIELVSLSANHAVIQVEQVMKAHGPLKSITSQQSASVMLTKYQGNWRISDGNTVIKSMK